MPEKSISLICGNNEYLVSKKAREIIDALLPRDEQLTALETVDGLADTVAAALDSLGKCEQAIMTAGLFSRRKVVWFKSVSFLSDTRTGKSEQVKERLGVFAGAAGKGLPAGHFLVVTAPKIDKRYAFYKTLAGGAAVFEFNIDERQYIADGQIREFVLSEFAKNGANIEEDALELFLGKMGADTRQIISEIEKLVMYTGGKSISRADVENITSSTRGIPAWDLADAAGNRDLKRALKILRQLFFQNESPVRLVISLENRFKDLMFYREALDRGWLCGTGRTRGAAFEWREADESTDDFFKNVMDRDPRSMHWYRTGILAGQAGRFTMGELKKCLSATVNTHTKLVSSGVSQELLLEALLVKLLSANKR